MRPMEIYCCGLIMGFLACVALCWVSPMTRFAWHEAAKHGAAIKVIQGDDAIWKWKDEVAK